MNLSHNTFECLERESIRGLGHSLRISLSLFHGFGIPRNFFKKSSHWSWIQNDAVLANRFKPVWRYYKTGSIIHRRLVSVYQTLKTLTLISDRLRFGDPLKLFWFRKQKLSWGLGEDVTRMVLDEQRRSAEWSAESIGIVSSRGLEFIRSLERCRRRWRKLRFRYRIRR